MVESWDLVNLRVVFPGKEIVMSPKISKLFCSISTFGGGNFNVTNIFGGNHINYNSSTTLILFGGDKIVNVGPRSIALRALE